MGAVTGVRAMWDGHPPPGERLHRCSLFHQSSILIGETESLIVGVSVRAKSLQSCLTL